MRTILVVIFFCFVYGSGFTQNVGIGTSAPLMKLHVAEGDRNVMLIQNTQSLDTNTLTGFYFRTGNGSKPYTGAIKTTGQDSVSARLGLFTKAATLANGTDERLSILDNGHVGINTTSPSNTLSVVGNTAFSGSVGIGTNAPAASAKFELSSTTQGFLPSRMTASQRTAIASPVAGLLVYQTDSPSGYYYFTGTNWVGVEGAGPGANSSATCVDYDQNVYPTFTIGNQTWMAENLRVTHYRNGDSIPNVIVDSEWSFLSTGAYCWYNNDSVTNRKYGPLYNWHAVDDSRGLCPEGWHVPTTSEWTQFSAYLGGTEVAGGKMKSVTALWNSPNTDATNTSGFSGLQGNYRSEYGNFSGNLGKGFWWTSTGGEEEWDDYGAWERSLWYNHGELIEGFTHKSDGFSVRCLRDY